MSNRAIRSLICCGSILFASLNAESIDADEYHWVNQNGGVFSVALNWHNATNPDENPPQTPGASDTAIFDVNLGVIDSYWVTFSTGAGVDHLLFTEDDVFWDLNGHSFNANSVIVNGGADFDLINGNFSTNLFDVAEGNGSSGTAWFSTNAVVGFNSMRIGKEGEGRLNLVSNAKATGSALGIGRFAQSTGHVKVSDTAELDVGTINVGLGSVAPSTLQVLDSGKIIAGQINVANGDSFTAGRLMASGSSNVNASSITVGFGGMGELEINDSADVVAGFLKIADHNGTATGHGMVNVFGGSLSANSGLVVGENGMGELKVHTSGQLTSANGTAIGTEAGAKGKITVEGLWNSSGNINVGRSGQASVLLQNGGQWSTDANAQILVGDLPGNNSLVSVAGWRLDQGNILPSSWSLGSHTSITLKNGNPEIYVVDGGQVRDPSGNSTMNIGVGASAMLNVQRSAVSANQIRCSELEIGTLNVGVALNGPGFGEANVNAGGIINANSITLGEGDGSFGLLKIDGQKVFQQIRLPSSVNTVGLTVGGFQGKGRVQVLNGGKLSTSSAAVGTAISNGEVIVRHQDSIWIAGGETVIGGNLSAGTVRAQNGGRFHADQITIDANGALRLRNGEVEFGLIGGNQLFNGGTISGYGTINGTRFVNAGYIRPGSSPGVLSIEADFEQTDSGTLDLEIYGLQASRIDLLAVDGDADLAGKVSITFRGGYAPSQGDFFELLTISGSLSGDFDEIEVHNLESGFLYETSLTNGIFRLTALNDGVFVPEPSSVLAIIAIGYIVLARRRRLSSAKCKH